MKKSNISRLILAMLATLSSYGANADSVTSACENLANTQWAAPMTLTCLNCFSSSPPRITMMTNIDVTSVTQTEKNQIYTTYRIQGTWGNLSLAPSSYCLDSTTSGELSQVVFEPNDNQALLATTNDHPDNMQVLNVAPNIVIYQTNNGDVFTNREAINLLK